MYKNIAGVFLVRKKDMLRGDCHCRHCGLELPRGIVGQARNDGTCGCFALFALARTIFGNCEDSVNAKADKSAPAA